LSLPRASIRTRSIRLVPVSPEWAEPAWKAIHDSLPELRPWLNWVRDASLQNTRQFCRLSLDAWVQGTHHNFFLLEGEEVVGGVSLRILKEGVGEIGYWVRTDRAGRGLATEAAQAILELGFEKLGLARLELQAGTGNVASQRVAEKIGMLCEGRLAMGTSGADERHDSFIFGMPRAAWDRLRKAGPGQPPTGMPADAGPQPDFSRGLLGAVVVDDEDGTVLMLAHMDREAYRLTLESGEAWFWSRSRGELWKKGATSGNTMQVTGLTLDCDGDAVLLRVIPAGPACHTGERSCFHRPLPRAQTARARGRSRQSRSN
jgi:phosphoribosyl-AMP cyclohydrolase/RimJ/RimL family protein N-acetyltransferase